MITKRCVGTDVQVKTDPSHVMLDVDYDSLENSFKRAEERYNRERANYFNTYADEAILISKSKRWQRAAFDYMRWAETLFNNSEKDSEQRLLAMDIMDRITKESSVRYKNICKHVDIMSENISGLPQDEKEKELDKLERAEYDCSSCYRNMIATQKRFIDLFQKGENYISPVQQGEIEAAARTAAMREKYYPKDHVYLAGRIIPPHRTPMKERVPELPEPYVDAENQPIDAYVWNEELDEVVIKPGYVSEDGMIDDQSVVIDPEAGAVTMKYRGGEPVTWNWWKPKDTTDLPEPGSWTEEYLKRSYRQFLEDNEFGVLKHRPYEDEMPEYNKKPKNND